MIQLQIQVYANYDAKILGKKLFERIVELNDACSVDYNTLLRALFFLYGNSCVISFNVCVK